jgi:hypothetical protein
MIKHYTTWFGKFDTKDDEGKKGLLDISSEKLEKLKLFDSTYNRYRVQTLEQYSYLAQFVNFVFWNDEYDYFVEHLEEDYSGEYEASL